MEGSNTKVSFIPKGSLVRDEPFLERRRPRSVIGFFAGLVFVASVSVYAGLYYQNNLLNKKVADRIDEIKKAQREFSKAPEVAEAKIFRARADLALEMLNSHTVTSPVFDFLSKNTLQRVLYNSFSFKQTPEGAVLDVSGEAPTYASLAYQVDVFRAQTNALTKFSVDGVTLSGFGTVNFSFSMTFSPTYLMYTKNLGSLEVEAPVVVTPIAETKKPQTVLPVLHAPEANAVAPWTPLSSTPVTASTTSVNTMSNSVATSTTVAPKVDKIVPVRSATSTKPTEKQSVLQSLWAKFKFW